MSRALNGVGKQDTCKSEKREFQAEGTSVCISSRKAASVAGDVKPGRRGGR